MIKMVEKSKFQDIIVEDGEGFGGGGQIGAKEIFMEQFRRCCIEGSKEMVKGGKKVKVVRGIATEIDVPNQREIFVNCVRIFETILTPDLEKESKINEQIKHLSAKVDNLKLDYKKVYNKTQHQYKNSSTNVYNRRIDDLADGFELENVNIHREKLVVLSRLLKEIGYFEEQSYMG
jgi:outer membrane murein-binding lipoprotein Lpp